ncbi:MAG: DUF5615 family PIN-like protein [Kiritimatiellia bacterium]
MKILLDMNLSPAWVCVLRDAGHVAIHWSAIGLGSAPDVEIFEWARENKYVVFTHDLDFGAILAATNADAPSVIQIRTADPSPEHAGNIVIKAVQQYGDHLRKGALISIDENKARVRILPF